MRLCRAADQKSSREFSEVETRSEAVNAGRSVFDVFAVKFSGNVFCVNEGQRIKEAQTPSGNACESFYRIKFNIGFCTLMNTVRDICPIRILVSIGIGLLDDTHAIIVLKIEGAHVKI